MCVFAKQKLKRKLGTNRQIKENSNYCLFSVYKNGCNYA